MKKKSLFAGAVLGCMLAISGAPAHAQDMGKFTLFGGYSYQTNNAANGVCDFFFGGCGGEDTTGLHGYTGSIVYHGTSHVGMEANFAGHNGNPTVFNETPTTNNGGEKDTIHQDSYSYTFGPNLSVAAGEHFSLFTHFLVGAAHEHQGFFEKDLPDTSCGAECTPETFTASARGNGVAVKVGGGVDWTHGRLGIRILQVDFIHEALWVTVACESLGDCSSQNQQFRTSNNNFELATGVTLNFGHRK